MNLAIAEAVRPAQFTTIPGMSLGAFWSPASGADIDGLYDLFPLADGAWMVVLGDVCSRVQPPAGPHGSALLTMAGAGHPTPLLLRADGSLVPADAHRDVTRLTLRPGDAVLLGNLPHITDPSGRDGLVDLVRGTGATAVELITRITELTDGLRSSARADMAALALSVPRG